MISTGIRDLKNNLSRYIRQVEAGERITITDRGRVVAELRPPERTAAKLTRYDELVAAGVIRPPLETGLLRIRWPDICLPPGTAAALIDEDRGD